MLITLVTFSVSGILAESLTCQAPDFGSLLDLNFEPCEFALKEKEHFTSTKIAIIFKYIHFMHNASSLICLLNIDKLPRIIKILHIHDT